MSAPWNQPQQQQQGGGWPAQQQAQQQQGGGWPAQQQAPQQQQQGPPAPSLDDALAGGGKAAFDQNTPVGIAIRGVIVSGEVQQTRFNPKFWDDGSPKWIVHVQVSGAEWSQDGGPWQPLRTAEDDKGDRTFYIKTWGPGFQALQDAIRAAGFGAASEALAPGSVFAGKHTGRQRNPAGGNDELLYAYHITAAGGATPAADFQQQQHAPPTPPAPQQQTAPPAQTQPPAQQGPWQQPAGPPEEPPF